MSTSVETMVLMIDSAEMQVVGDRGAPSKGALRFTMAGDKIVGMTWVKLESEPLKLKPITVTVALTDLIDVVARLARAAGERSAGIL